MNLIRRIRMFLLLRKANRILHRAKARRAYLNRPYQPSVHQVSYPPDERDIGHTPPSLFYFAAAAVMFGLVVYLNFFHDEPAARSACTQLASK